MVTAGNPKSTRPFGRLARLGALATAVVAPFGCTREFYREWANQDATEAVFEKTRDPRWRLDTFSIEPPALSRFADPYDQDFPPAPPDDPAAEALSPVPQWPDNRLMVPVEGTGYLDLLERWKEEQDAAAGTVSHVGSTRPPGQSGRIDSGRGSAPAQPPGPPGGGSPFAPGGGSSDNAPPTRGTPGTGAPAPAAERPAAPLGLKPDAPDRTIAVIPPGGLAGRRSAGNSGTDSEHSTPILLADARPSPTTAALPPPRPASSFATNPTGKPGGLRDGDVRRTARQDGRAPGPPPGSQVPLEPPRYQTPAGRDGLPPRVEVPLDPNQNIRDMNDATTRLPAQMRPAGPGGTFNEEQAAELSAILVPTLVPLDIAAATGLPRGSQPYKITLQQAFMLSLINSRYYQTNLENLYIAALNVTLQRFAFEPQFYAGMTPLTSPLGAGFPGLNPANAFTYNTRFSPGGQVSALTLGEVAGVGKLLNSGGQILAGFANQVVFNFVGKNPIQPTVQSSLPLTFLQPFLRGGGRAVVMENLTLAERALLYQARAFAKFRQEFIVTILTGGSVQNFGQNFTLSGFTTAGNIDPVVGFLPVIVDVLQIDIDRKNVAYFERLVQLYEQLIQGEASGLSQLQVDQAKSNLVSARGRLVTDTLAYRRDVDQYRFQLGLPPDVPIVPDLGLVQPFRDVFQKIDDWQKNKARKLEDLPGIVGAIPELEDVVLDGRSVLGIYKGSESYTEEETLEDILQAGVRIALEFRLDLMNARAQLYDAWRQLRVTANALKGYLNVALTNQFLTPPTTTNPFGFYSQAKQFRLVLNAELPLIRVAERNTFRRSIISYQQQRRLLQNTEDNIKAQLRQDIRTMQVAYIQYEIAKRNLILQIRLKDQAFEQIVAPPQAGAGTQGLAQSANAATQTTNLIGFQNGLIGGEITLINTWAAYELARLVLYRDIGTLPYDEWEAFSEVFPAEYRGPSLGPGTSNTRPAAAETPRPAQSVGRQGDRPGTGVALGAGGNRPGQRPGHE
jgi:hypothetical protein